MVKTTGDGFIATFDSPVEAVRCSIVIQQNLLGRNAPLPRQSRIEYRLGVNLGDVIVDPDDVYGDGVNIASRIEGLAEPGQVYISGAIYEQIKHKVVCGYKSLGDRRVKNITDPVRVYRVLPDADAVGRTRGRRETLLISMLSIALLVIASGVLWYFLSQWHFEIDRQVAAPISAPAGTPQAQPSATETAGTNPTTSPSVPATAPPSAIPAPAASPMQSAGPMREPEMQAVRGGSFMMGSNDDPSEGPVHQVAVRTFSLAKYPVTVGEWNECAAANACGFVAASGDDAPVTNVSWIDAQQYVAWLGKNTGKPYRLPSEAEWEYAARGGTRTKYWWGDKLERGVASCRNCGDSVSGQPTKVGSYKPNPFGLYDMGGTVDQWIEDCWQKNYQGAPTDGSAWVRGDCASHVIRSGSWKNDAGYVRPSNRDSYDTNVRYPTHDFRVALGP